MNEGIKNPLEQALVDAAAEPAHRPEFYRLLLESEIFVLGRTDAEGEGRITVKAGEKVLLANWQKSDGTPVIPFFTSLDALRQAIKEEQSHLALPARAFFELTKGATLTLNPSLSYGKEFLPNEIEALLSTGMNQASQRRVVEKSTQVLLGQPADYPVEMVSALTTLLAKHSTVKAAYLGLMHAPSMQEKPSLVVGLEGESDIEQALKEAGTVAADTAPKDQPVDFVRVRRGDKGISEYFLGSVKPFYERTWGTKLRSFLGHGRA